MADPSAAMEELVLALIVGCKGVVEEKNAVIQGLEEEVQAMAQESLDADRPYSEIKAERTRQELLRAAGKFLYTCADPNFVALSHFGRVTVLGEEFGEVCRAALDAEKIAEGRGDPEGALKKLRTELIQVAAVAVAYIEGLDRALTSREVRG